MSNGLLGVACFVGENEGGRQCRNANAEVKQSVSVCCEGVGICCVVCVLDVGAGRVGGVGEVILGFGVKIMWGAWAARTGKCGEWGRRLREGMRRSLEDAVVVDGCDIRVGGGLVLGQE